MTDRLAAILGFNAVHFERKGSSLYGDTAAAPSPDLDKVSPYVGVTYDITPEVLTYASYSDIFQVQEQKDINGRFLDPVKGLNAEVGVKAEWLNKQLLTTFAVFSAQQNGLATYAGTDPDQSDFYEAKDVKSKGIELEATGRISERSRLTVGVDALEAHRTGWQQNL